jgi:hypothetical protein
MRLIHAAAIFVSISISCVAPPTKDQECHFEEGSPLKGIQMNTLRLMSGERVEGDHMLDSNCKLNGFSVTYHDNGYIHQVMIHRDGQKIGPMYQFNNDGSIASIEYYEQGIINGISRYYQSNGRLERLCQHSHGSLIRCDSVRYNIAR